MPPPVLPVARNTCPHGLAPTAPAARLDAASEDGGNIESVVRDYLALEDICQVPRQARVPLQLANELGRILLYTRAVFLGEAPFGREAKTDKAARVFAACLLMPETAVRTSVGQTGSRPDEWDLELLLRLKHRFGVSAETFNYRLLELGLITPERQSELRAAIKAYYEKHAFAEPGKSRRILSPNGRLGDLLHTALRRADPEAAAIAARLKRQKISVER